MSRKLSVTEPHPSVPKSGGYIGSGRGGAGNHQRFKPEEVTSGPNASGPASRVPLTKPTKRVVPAGRGGAGNFVSGNEENIFQFDEEMIKKRSETVPAPIYKIGRGGAGNTFWERPAGSDRRKDSSDSSASESERVTALRRDSGGVLSIFSRRSA